MIKADREDYYNSLGFTQTYHGILEYKILWSINHLREKNHLSTASRIGKLIEKDTAYTTVLLNIYWQWNYVGKKMVKTTKQKNKTSDGSSFHWILTNKGIKKLRELENKFGSISLPL